MLLARTTIAARWKQIVRLEQLPSSTMHSSPSCTRKYSGCVSPPDAAADLHQRQRKLNEENGCPQPLSYAL